MAQLTGNTNNLSLTMGAFTTQTPGHATVMNQVWQQMLDNDAFNDAQITALRQLIQGFVNRIEGVEARCTALETRCSTLETAVKELQSANPNVTNPTPITEVPVPANNYQVTVDFSFVTGGGFVHGADDGHWVATNTLTASATTNAPGATIVSYDWTVKSGDVVVRHFVDTQPQYIFRDSAVGGYDVTLMVTDSTGLTGTITHYIESAGEP